MSGTCTKVLIIEALGRLCVDGRLGRIRIDGLVAPSLRVGRPCVPGQTRGTFISQQSRTCAHVDITIPLNRIYSISAD